MTELNHLFFFKSLLCAASRGRNILHGFKLRTIQAVLSNQPSKFTIQLPLSIKFITYDVKKLKGKYKYLSDINETHWL